MARRRWRICRLTTLHEGGGPVLEQVPAVGDLQRPRSAFVGPLAISAAAVATDDLDIGMRGKPVRDGGALTVRQEVDGAATFEIADDRPIALALQPGEIVDADDADGGRRWCRAAPEQAQQSVGAHRHGEALGEPFAGAAAKHEGDRVGERVET